VKRKKKRLAGGLPRDACAKHGKCKAQLTGQEALEEKKKCEDSSKVEFEKRAR